MTDHRTEQGEGRRGGVLVLDEELVPVGFEVPCPASAVAVLNLDRPTKVYCGGLDGHEGPHRFLVEWDDPAPARTQEDR